MSSGTPVWNFIPSSLSSVLASTSGTRTGCMRPPSSLTKNVTASPRVEFFGDEDWLGGATLATWPLELDVPPAIDGPRSRCIRPRPNAKNRHAAIASHVAIEDQLAF